MAPTATPTNPANCTVGDWEGYSACSRSCNGGLKQRVRKVLVNPQHGGRNCPVLASSSPCKRVCCEGHYKSDRLLNAVYHNAQYFFSRDSKNQEKLKIEHPNWTRSNRIVHLRNYMWRRQSKSVRSVFETMSNASAKASDGIVCESCPQGKYRQYSSTFPSCSVCDDGKFARLKGAGKCMTCPNSKYSRVRRTVCSQCKQGRYLHFPHDSKAAICTRFTKCPPGQYLDEQMLQADGTCKHCPVGKYKPQQAMWSTSCKVCTGCAVGEERLGCGNSSAAGQIPFSISSQGHCSSCPPGRSGNGTGRCVDCTIGKYQIESGKLECRSCRPGEIQKEAASAKPCTPCAEGKFANGLTLSCDDCEQGMYTISLGQTRCEKCEEGYFGAKGASRTSKEHCNKCATGRYQDQEGQGSCIQCPANYRAQAAGAAYCRRCPKGEFAEEAYGKIFCSVCETGRFTRTNNRTGEGLCVMCPFGKYQTGVKGGTGTHIAKDGTLIVGTRSCRSCPKGAYQDKQGRLECKKCQQGKYANKKEQISCTACAKGNYQPLVGTASCLKCSAGMYESSSGKSSCTLCPGESWIK
jgi:hypothetical protein